MNGRLIVERFGGQSALARLLKKSQSTVSYWVKSDKIPAKYWDALIRLGREQGFELSAPDFVLPRTLVGAPTPVIEIKASDSGKATEAANVVTQESDSEELDHVQDQVPSQFLFYESDQGTIKVQVLLEDETAWASQRGMSQIFEVDVRTVNEHLQNIFASNELTDSVIRKFRITAPDGKSYEVAFYNLDAIISVGYRVNSYKATQFRKWATTVLRSYLTKGFALDDERLKAGKQHFGKDYFDELLERIREIRASERRFYQKITDIFAQCSIDYDKDSPICKQFYAHVQDKLHFAIHGHTAAELIELRADATKPHMGLQTWKNEAKGGKITKTDVTVGKNYLTAKELEDMNRLVAMYLDWAENFARRQVALTMKEWAEKLDGFLSFNAYEVLSGYGTVRRDVAERRATLEYEKFRVIQDHEYKSDFDRVVDEIRTSKRLPKLADSSSMQ